MALLAEQTRFNVAKVDVDVAVCTNDFISGCGVVILVIIATLMGAFKYTKHNTAAVIPTGISVKCKSFNKRCRSRLLYDACYR